MSDSDHANFGHAVATATRLLRRVFDRRASELDLTRAQWRALSCIARSQGVTQAEVAEELDLEAIAVGRVIDRLEAAGFVDRRDDPEDRRCWRLHLAPKAKNSIASMRRIAAALQAETLVGVDPQDLATTLRVLTRVNETLHELDRNGRNAASQAGASK